MFLEEKTAHQSNKPSTLNKEAPETHLEQPRLYKESHTTVPFSVFRCGFFSGGSRRYPNRSSFMSRTRFQDKLETISSELQQIVTIDEALFIKRQVDVRCFFCIGSSASLLVHLFASSKWPVHNLRSLFK